MKRSQARLSEGDGVKPTAQAKQVDRFYRQLKQKGGFAISFGVFTCLTVETNPAFDSTHTLAEEGDDEDRPVDEAIGSLQAVMIEGGAIRFTGCVFGSQPPECIKSPHGVRGQSSQVATDSGERLVRFVQRAPTQGSGHF